MDNKSLHTALLSAPSPQPLPHIDHPADSSFLILSTGDAFYPLSVWPQEFKLIFWKKPISDKDTFKLFLFLIGNGCSPTSSHIGSSHRNVWTTDRKAEKRARQLDFLFSNIDNKSNI